MRRILAVSTTSPIRLESTIWVMNIQAMSSVLVESHIIDDDDDNDDDNDDDKHVSFRYKSTTLQR